MVDGEDVLKGEGLEVELVGGVVVGGDGFGVAVDHDGLVAHFAECECGVDAAVVEFDALSDAVGAAAEDHDLLGVVGGADGVWRVVGGVVVGGVLDAGDGDGVPGFGDAELESAVADVGLREVEDA